MQRTTIMIPRELIEKLKIRAQRENLGYQAIVRMILSRHADEPTVIK